MDRRHVLGLGGAGLMAALSPAWLARGFSCQSNDPPKLDDLQRGIERARRIGKPLVVFVVPTDAGQRRERGQAFGYALRLGGDGLLADLALAEIVCARMTDVAQRFHELKAQAEPMFFVISSDDGHAHIAPSVVELDAAPSWLDVKPYELEGAFKRWVQPLVLELRRALVGDTADAGNATLIKRERCARLTLEAATLERVTRAIADARAPDRELIERAAALFRAEAARSDRAHKVWIPELALVGSSRWLQHPAPGSRWAEELGANEILENEHTRPLGEEDEYVSDERTCPGCGMGFVSEFSRRFLFFLTRKD